MNGACLNTITEKQPTVEPLLLTVNQAAALLNLSRSSFYALLSAQRFSFQPFFLGSKRLYRRCDIEAFVGGGLKANC